MYKGQAISIIEPINNKKNSINTEIFVTWNNPLYIPIPDPIDWRFKVFKDNTPAYKNTIADILIKYVLDIFL